MALRALSRGFSLIEVLTALFVISMTLVIFHAVLTGEQVNRIAKDRTLALSIAGTKLEALRGAGYDLLPASGSFSDTQLSLLPSGSGSMTVTTFNTKTKQVVVTVSWKEPQETGTRSVSLTTLVTQIGGL